MPYYIKSKQAQGRFRAGQCHTAKGRVWEDKAFSKEQLAALKKDPVLSVKKLSDADAEAKRAELGQEDANAENAAQTTGAGA